MLFISIETLTIIMVLDQALWNVGFVCRRLLLLSISATRKIELDWRPKNILSKYDSNSTAIILKEAAKIQFLSHRDELLSSIKVRSGIKRVSHINS